MLQGCAKEEKACSLSVFVSHFTLKCTCIVSADQRETTEKIKCADKFNCDGTENREKEWRSQFLLHLKFFHLPNWIEAKSNIDFLLHLDPFFLHSTQLLCFRPICHPGWFTVGLLVTDEKPLYVFFTSCFWSFYSRVSRNRPCTAMWRQYKSA